jgi:hypothetical protein
LRIDRAVVQAAPMTALDVDAVRARFPALTRTLDGEPVVSSETLPLLVEAGFLAGPRRAVLRP